MVRSSERLIVKAGDLVFAQGDVADAAYLVLSGDVDLTVTNDAGTRHLAVRQAGEMFGEMAIVNDRPRQSTATARSDCALLPITRDQISERIETVDPLLRFCIGGLLDRFSGTIGKVASLGGAEEPQGGSLWSAHRMAASDILSFEHQLRRGIERGELDLYFQPIVRLGTRHLAGFEALIRWQHPERGLLQPNDFIPLAEASGAICAITTFCLEQVGRQFGALRSAALANPAGVERLFLSVNVSGIDLLQSAFAARAVSILCDAGVEPEDIRLEVTESILMKDAERCAKTLEHCRDQGFKIAIDDFGTGYSSLNYLNTLPISVLKMDKSFTLSLLAEATGRKIIGAILQLGSELGLAVIAEGIETEAQALMLSGMGCAFGQGYLFGRPLSHAETLDLIGTWEAGSAAVVPALRDARRA